MCGVGGGLPPPEAHAELQQPQTRRAEPRDRRPIVLQLRADGTEEQVDVEHERHARGDRQIHPVPTWGPSAEAVTRPVLSLIR